MFTYIYHKKWTIHEGIHILESYGSPTAPFHPSNQPTSTQRIIIQPHRYPSTRKVCPTFRWCLGGRFGDLRPSPFSDINNLKPPRFCWDKLWLAGSFNPWDAHIPKHGSRRRNYHLHRYWPDTTDTASSMRGGGKEEWEHRDIEKDATERCWRSELFWCFRDGFFSLEKLEFWWFSLFDTESVECPSQTGLESKRKATCGQLGKASKRPSTNSSPFLDFLHRSAIFFSETRPPFWQRGFSAQTISSKPLCVPVSHSFSLPTYPRECEWSCGSWSLLANLWMGSCN